MGLDVSLYVMSWFTPRPALDHMIFFNEGKENYRRGWLGSAEELLLRSLEENMVSKEPLRFIDAGMACQSYLLLGRICREWPEEERMSGVEFYFGRAALLGDDATRLRATVELGYACLGVDDWELAESKVSEAQKALMGARLGFFSRRYWRKRVADLEQAVLDYS